jgi:hypothetical protein
MRCKGGRKKERRKEGKKERVKDKDGKELTFRAV